MPKTNYITLKKKGISKLIVKIIPQKWFTTSIKTKSSFCQKHNECSFAGRRNDIFFKIAFCKQKSVKNSKEVPNNKLKKEKYSELTNLCDCII